MLLNDYKKENNLKLKDLAFSLNLTEATVVQYLKQRRRPSTRLATLIDIVTKGKVTAKDFEDIPPRKKGNPQLNIKLFKQKNAN